MTRFRPRTLGREHRQLAAGTGELVGGAVADQSPGVAFSLSHGGWHADVAGRILGDADLLPRLVTQDRVNAQIAWMGHGSTALEEGVRLVVSAAFHDRVDLLATAVDHHGRVRRTAAGGLALWKESCTRGDLKRVLAIARDCGRRDLARALLAMTWALHPDLHGPALREGLAQATGKSEPPWADLAAALLVAAGEPAPDWAGHPADLAPAPSEPARSAWVDRAHAWLLAATGHEDVTVDDLLPALVERGPQRAGRPVRDLWAAVASSLSVIAPAVVGRIRDFVRALERVPMEPVAVREAFEGFSAPLARATHDASDDMLKAWSALFARDKSEYRGQRSQMSRHAALLAIATGDVRWVELAIDLGEATEEAYLRVHVLNPAPTALAALVRQGMPPTEVFALMAHIVAIDVASIAPVTADYLLFGLGRALARRGDTTSPVTAFRKIKHPWIHGQLLATAPEDNDVAGALLPCAVDVAWPLARAFALQGLFRSLARAGTTAQLETALDVAWALEDTEMILTGLEAVLAAWRSRDDGRTLRDRVAENPAFGPELTGGYRERFAALLADAPPPEQRTHEDDTTTLAGGELPDRPSFGPDDWAMLGASWLLVRPPRRDTLALLSTKVAQASLTSAAVTVVLACVDAGVFVAWGPALAPLADLDVDGRGWRACLDALVEANNDALVEDVVRWLCVGERGAIVARSFDDDHVRRYLPGLRADFAASDFGRSYPLLRQAGRPLLLAFAQRFAVDVRTSWMICAELLARLATSDELLALHALWLAPAEERS